MNQFHHDDNGQKAVRDAVLGPGFYRFYSEDARYVYMDKGQFATILQKRYAVDTILQGRNGDAVAIEEKIVRWKGYPYSAITLETDSCTVPGKESKGWMHYGQADYLNYAMCQESGDLLLYLIDFQLLKKKFWPVVEQFKETQTEQINKTLCRIVPLEWVKSEVGYVQRLIRATPEGADVVRAYNND